MSTQSQNFGKGSAGSNLSAAEIREIAEKALAHVPSTQKVLAIIPDMSRDDNTDTLFPIILEILSSKGIKDFDALVAQGTHPPISEKEKLEKIGLSDFAGRIFDHEWNNPQMLTRIGRFEADEVSQITAGTFAQAVDLTINKLVKAYDTILILGATVPHEVAGFSGGAKYFFPGISGADLTNATHWIGALAGIENIIGRIETPTRQMIEKAADLIPAKIINFSSVVSRNRVDDLVTHALFAGDFRSSLRKAAEISRQVHIKYVGQKFKRVVAILDRHYNEMWTGGKASYKLGGIIEDGGELVIYAPHLTGISETHAEFIEKFGYAPIEKVRELAENSEELQKNLCVAAHLAHVSYSGHFEDAKIPKYAITMASGLDRATCEKVNLGFIDHQKFNPKDYLDDPQTLVVENAGRDLYLLEESGSRS